MPFESYAVSPDSISVNLTPENPAPNENVTITLTSYVSNLDSVLISWFVNEKKSSSQIGEKSFSVSAPGAGLETTVRVIVSLPDGQIEKRIIIKPSVMVLLWQAIDSYVPPFYRGKAMPTLDSEIKVVALPEIRNKTGAVNPKNMTYAWKLNYNNEVGGSGYGKSFFTYINDYLENGDNIEVIASTIDGQSSLRASIDISATQPQISFYKNDIKLGILWEQALSDGHKIQGDEIETIIAEPYFISPKEIWSPRLLWNWSINDTKIEILGFRQDSIPLKVESGVSGVSRLKLEIENQNQLLETVSKEINIEF